MSTIAELEARNAALRAAVEARLAGTTAVTPVELPADVPADFRQANAKWTFKVAEPAPPVNVEAAMVRASATPEALEAAWSAIKSKRSRIAAAAAAKRPPVRLIGITGQAGAGKNLAASMVPEATILHFADTIYAMLAIMLGVSTDDLRDRAYKETRVQWLGKSPRELLQTLGTEWGRQMIRDDVWVTIAGRAIEAATEDAPIVLADLRFNNEAEFIRARGGEVWEVVRPASGLPSNHSSEAGIRRDLIDRTLVNDGTPESLRAQVLAACGA